MNHKQRIFCRAMAEGKSVEAAAAEAGYNLAYARKKAEEPHVLAIIERMGEAKAGEKGVEREEQRAGGPLRPAPAQREAGTDVPAVLWGIIENDDAEETAVVSAVRALIAYDKAHPSAPEPPAATIIDDIPPCADCPLGRAANL